MALEKLNQFLNDPNRERQSDKVVLVLIVLCLIVFAVHNLVAYDFWWQLSTGYLVRTSGWPTIDPFSYGFPGRTWIELRWLYFVTISFIYDIIGVNGLIIVKAAWVTVAGFLLFQIGRGEKRWAVNLSLLLVLALIHQRMMIRPELVTYMLLTAFLLSIRKFQSDERSLWLFLLPILQIVWVNSHTLYVLGPAVIWIYTCAEIAGAVIPANPIFEPRTRMSWSKLRLLIIISVLVTLACVVNPYGLRGALFAAELYSEIQSGQGLNDVISELRSPFTAAGFSVLFVTYVVFVGISAIGFFLRRRSISFGWLGLWGAFLYLSILAERNLPLFGIVSSATIMINFGGLTAPAAFRWLSRAACALFCIVMIPLVVSNYYYRSIDPDRKFGLGVAERRFPIRAMGFVAAEKLPLPVITNLAESAYTIFKGGPKSAYIDGRAEVYGGANLVPAINMFATGDDLTEKMSSLNVSTLIASLETDLTLIGRLLKDPNWTAVYFDDSHIIFLRKGPTTNDLIDRLKINWGDPKSNSADTPVGLSSDNWLANIFPTVGDSGPPRVLGQLFINAGNVELGQQYLERALELWPYDPKVCLQLGFLYRAQRREPDAAKLLARVPDEVLEKPSMIGYSATLYESYNNMGAATDAWLKLRATGDTSTALYQHLANTAVAAERWDAAYIAFDALSVGAQNDIGVLNNLGSVAYKLGKKPEAIEAFERSLTVKPEQPQILSNMGVLKAETGDLNGARQAFEKALSIDPGFEQARQFLDRLNGEQPKK